MGSVNGTPAGWSGSIIPRCAIKPGVRTISPSVSVYVSWPLCAAGLAIDAWAGCWCGGYRMNHKKLYRLYHEEKLMVRRRGGRKRAMGTRAPMLLPERLNQRWSLDFIADTLSDGRRFRILCVVDDFSRECLACVVDTSLSGVRVVRELKRLTGERATPQVIVSDNGSELTSVAILRWVPGRVAWHYIEPGKPVQNAFIESFNSRLTRRVPERTPVRQSDRSAADPSKPGGLIIIMRDRIRVSVR